MRTTKVDMAIMSHLSDAQIYMSFDLAMANKHINFAKMLVLRYENTSVNISYEELDHIWEEVCSKS